MFHWTVDLGNIFTIVGTVVTLLLFLHKYDKKIDMRHQANVATSDEMNKTMNRIEIKVDDNTSVTDGVGKEITTHIAEDRIIHEEFKRRLTRIEDKL